MGYIAVSATQPSSVTLKCHNPVFQHWTLPCVNWPVALQDFTDIDSRGLDETSKILVMYFLINLVEQVRIPAVLQHHERFNADETVAGEAVDQTIMCRYHLGGRQTPSDCI